MLRVLSDLTITSRIDVAPADGVTYAQGEWVLPNGSKAINGTTIPIGCVFNMTDSGGQDGLSKDTDPVTLNTTQDATVGGAEKVTVIAGPFRGFTDKVNTNHGTPSAGSPLTVISGVLEVATLGTHHVVAVCEEVVTGFEHRGASYDGWRFKTV